MNQIPDQQNMPIQLERLAAQRELYSSAKKWHVAQLIISVLLPVGLAVTSLIVPDFSVVGAIYGVISFLADIILLEPGIKTRKTKAAKIQELFDCDVLQLPKSPLKTIDDIAVEEVLHYYNAHIKIATNIERIKDWYSPSVGRLPMHIARILCQRTNCWWDSKLRGRYAQFLKYVAIAVFAAIIIGGFLANLSLIEVALITSGLVPFFQFCVKQWTDNQEAAKRLDELRVYSTQIWNSALNGTLPESEVEISCRRLQDEIFDHRSKSPLILDLYYKLFRDEQEELMNRSSEILVEEAQSALQT